MIYDYFKKTAWSDGIFSHFWLGFLEKHLANTQKYQCTLYFTFMINVRPSISKYSVSYSQNNLVLSIYGGERVNLYYTERVKLHCIERVIVDNRKGYSLYYRQG